MNKRYKKEQKEAKKVIKFGNAKLKKMIKDTDKKVEEIRNKEEKIVKTRKGLSTKAIVITCAALAGASFISGRREGFKAGFEKGFEVSKATHEQQGYVQAIGDVINRFTSK